MSAKSFLASFLAAASLASPSTGQESVAMGVIKEAGEIISVQIFNAPSAQSSLVSFKADKPRRFEMTTGLRYYGHVSAGQVVCLVYRGDLKDGDVSMALFNPGQDGSANMKTTLGERSGSEGRFLSKDGRFAFVFTPSTLVSDSNGDPASPCEGQDILVWHGPALPSGDIPLRKAAILLTREEKPATKELRVYSNGDVCLDDGPIASLSKEQLEVFYKSGSIPVRLLAESMGFTVGWSGGAVALVKDGLDIAFDIGSAHYRVNEQYAKLPKGDFWISNGETMADSSFISEIAGLSAS
jgi:hypothetical protein